MNNKATLESVGTFGCQQAYEEEALAHEATKAELARERTRNREGIRILEAALPTAGFPVKGTMGKVVRVLRGDRR